MEWNIPRVSDSPLQFTLEPGSQIFIVGANGSGKSALIQQVSSSRTDGARIRRLSAHRQTWLQSGRIDITPLARRQFEESDRQYESRPDARWLDHLAHQRQVAILFDLVAKENERARSISRHIDDENPDQARIVALESPPPFAQLNELLRLGTLTSPWQNLDFSGLCSFRTLALRWPNDGFQERTTANRAGTTPRNAPKGDSWLSSAPLGSK